MKLRNTSIAGLIAVMLLLTSGCSTAVLFGERGTDGFLDDSTNTTTSEYDVIPSDTPYVPSSTKPSEENNSITCPDVDIFYDNEICCGDIYIVISCEFSIYIDKVCKLAF